MGDAWSGLYITSSGVGCCECPFMNAALVGRVVLRFENMGQRRVRAGFGCREQSVGGVGMTRGYPLSEGEPPFVGFRWSRVQRHPGYPELRNCVGCAGCSAVWQGGAAGHRTWGSGVGITGSWKIQGTGDKGGVKAVRGMISGGGLPMWLGVEARTSSG